ncbi:hypothetical protein HY311_02310 [Candidatus Nomurabacteria bacterium]|nr:hypothetical protein [Candidatus Nomurabacteria bacterium]
MARLYFTRSGADRITRQKQELFDKLKSKQGQKGEAAEIGGNQWHDNFSFEQLCREEQMLNAQIAEINAKMAEMMVVDEAPTDTTELRIGHIAVLDVDGEAKVYQVGGFEDSEANVDPPVISYLAPLIRPFIGREQGHTTRLQIAGKTKQVTLDDIRLPRKEE